MKSVSFAFIWLLLCLSSSYAQELTQKQRTTIDSLTNHWNINQNPGGAIGIIQHGKVLFQSALGYADVAKTQKITTETSFQLAQMSDSFVAYALLQLHHEGSLSLDDSVVKYLPQLKNIPASLKVKHLLQQSSGIHDFEVLKNIVGWSDTKPFSEEDALALVGAQKELSFTAGSEFAYSRSNILLASEVISRASNLPFATYLETKVFEPLGMKNSFVLSSKRQADDGSAKSYRRSEDGKMIAVQSKKETYASINIVSSIEDLIKWEQNLLSPSSKTRKTVAHFNSFVKLDNATFYKVPQGTLTYGQRYVHKERGVDTAMSTGGIDGFASAVFNFPSEHFTVITLSNNGEGYNGYIGMLSAHAILDEAFTEPFSVDFGNINAIPLDKEYIKKYEGNYWDALGEISREIQVENDTLRYIRTNGNRTAFIPLSKNRFQMMTDFDDKVFLTFSESQGTTTMSYEYGEATPIPFKKYSTPAFAKADLDSYAGSYFCKELDLSFSISADNKKLKVENTSHKMTFKTITKTIFSGDQWFMRSIEFDVKEKGTVMGFYVRNDAIRNLWFEKVK